MPLLRTTQQNLQRTKRGKIICKSTEVYSRNDIGCGVLCCSECVYIQPLKPTLSNNVYLIPDLLTIKHQIDILTSPLFLSKFNVILLQSIIEIIKEQNYALYKRIESEVTQCNEYNAPIYIFMDNLNKNTCANNENHENNALQIVQCYKWYDTHLSLNCDDSSSFHLFVITESAKSVQLLHSLNAKVQAITLKCMVSTLFPSELSNLCDLLSCAASDTTDAQDKKSKNIFYKPHWKKHRITNELKKSANNVFKGKYHSIRGFGGNAFGKVSAPNGEIFIRGLNNINRAIHGDIVVVKLLQIANEGEIVGVIETNWRAFCGSLQVRKDNKRNSSNKILFVPIDSRIPKIKIMSSQIANLMDKRIIVHIDEWSINSKYPSGHYTETIGVIGDLETETQCLLLEHDIPYDPWSDAVLQCLPAVGDEIDMKKMGNYKRRNLCDESVTIFSVDPPSCVDIDDALHYKELINGNVEIGVHIADVAHYVEANSALDKEAAKRGTSVYLVDRRIDMLPSLLSTDLCSLKPNKKRLSFSVFWELKIDNGSIEIINTSFARCIIRSVAALSYQEAQNMINDKRDNTEIAKSLRGLLFVSKILKKDRIKCGALSLSSLKPSFKFNSQKELNRIESYKMYETNHLIEEFMLLANISVAKKILESFPSFAMLRRHPAPSNEMLSPLIKSAATRGFKINTQNSKQLALSLDKCVDEKNKSLNELLRIITTRCMTQAVYFISGSVANAKDYNHYGLASPIYTHFTSPIRRYADIIVHRQLSHCCGYSPFQQTQNIQSIIQDIVHSINRRHRMAQYINRASSNLYTLMFFDNISNINNGDKPIICDAIISQLDTNCLNVFIAKYCMERRIYLNNKHEWKFDSVKLTLYKISPPAIKYQIFDKVAVKIYVKTSKYHRKNLIIELIDSNFNTNATQQNEIDVPVFCN